MFHKNKKNAAIFLCLLLIASITGLSGCQKGNQYETATRSIFQMDTVITMTVKGINPEFICDEMEQAIRVFEQDASMFKEGSEVWAINEQAGIDAVKVSDDVYYVIEQAVKYGAESDGLFDVTVGPLSRLWDVTSENPVIPSQQEVEAALALVDYRDVLLTEDSGVMLARPGQMMDLGGIAKGYALDICRRVLEQHEDEIVLAHISIGGNILAFKSKEDGQPYNVGIRTPEPYNESYFCVLQLTDTVISTSGGYERFFERDGALYQHIIDPRTGWPVEGSILSVSVIVPDGLTADYMSTRMFVGGLDYSLELMENQGVEAVVVDASGTVYITASLQDQFVEEMSNTEKYDFVFV